MSLVDGTERTCRTLSGDVCCWRQSRKHMLGMTISHFDPEQTRHQVFPIINCSSSVSTVWKNFLNCGAILRYARAFPLGKERNQHRQVAVSFRKLFRGQNWLRTHTLEGAMLSTDRSGRNQTCPIGLSHMGVGF